MHLPGLLPLFVLLVPLPNAKPVQQPEPNSQDEELRPYPAPDVEALRDQWRNDHGASWRTLVDGETGWVEMLHGGSALAPLVPRNDPEWIESARYWIEQTEEMVGIASGELVVDRVKLLPLSLAGSTDKISVRLRQELAGLAVEGGVVNVLMDLDGNLLSIQSRGLPVAKLQTQPALDARTALDLAGDAFLEHTGVVALSAGAPELIVAQDVRAGIRRARLTWRIDLHWSDAGTQPESWRLHVDARTGVVFRKTTLIHEFDVGGTVSTMATPGTLPDTGSNPETPQPAAYVRVTSSAGTVYTDENGQFNFPGVNGPLNVTVDYVGLWNDVRNSNGSDYGLTVSANTGQGNAILMNPASSGQITAQANAYVHVGKLRDWIRSVDPTDSTADFTAISNVNLNDTCNAFYNGSSVNFFLPGGGCVNTAYSTVVAHEMGHWLNVLYGTGNGSDGMGEGNADVFSMYQYDDPIVGQDFCGSGCHIRTGNNTRQFCGDSNPGCHGGVHDNGEVWGGAAWKVRRNLNQSLGNTIGDMTANTLFLGWMNGYDQTQIRSIIEVQWLTLDDNDGNIDNGTPNYQDIDAGFREQGFPGYDVPLVQISNVTLLPDTQDEVGPYQVDASLVAVANPPLASATLHYRVNGGSFTPVAMANVGGDVYSASIPGQSSPAEVEYYVSGTDSQGFSESFPADAPSSSLNFNVGILTTFFFNEFEGANNEGWTGGVAGDDATTGVWVRVDPRGTAAQPEDDHTLPPGDTCWVTGQGSVGGSLGENDVDGGSTTLLSPVFDASGLGNPKIRYWRWYSNDKGAEPNSDTFVIDISNDGGSSWSSVEVVGPSGAESNGGWFEHVFAINDVLTPSANMRMRFIASDLAGGSIVEAAIDDIRGTDLAASGGPDCNNNGVDDGDDIKNGTSEDCDGNGVPDECQPDCDSDGIPDVCETDCNGNGTPDDCESFADCNSNGIPDECEADCDGDGTPDDCEADCNGNGTPDDCESFADCNSNGIPDECEADCDGDGTPDDCEADCNGNGTPDDCESFADCNSNGIPDECEADCDGDGTPDDCEADCNGNGTPDDCESFADCNSNGIPDECEADCDGDGTPDDCEADCNGNGTPDDCESFADCNSNGIPDECEADCDGDGTPDDCEADCNGNGTPDDCESFADCNSNGIPDECEADCDGDGTPDDCEADCNGNGTPDDCESFADCNSNGIPDECEADCDGDGTPDDCEADCNGNGTPDDCESFADCNSNGIPDECDISSGTSSDLNGNGIPDECECFALNYCQTAANSAGPGAVIGASGSLSVVLNDTVLITTGLPANQFGIFYYGLGQVEFPFGNGFRCIGGGAVYRLPVTRADAAGTNEFALDFNDLPNGGEISGGEVWNFQHWYRDPMGGGSSFNLSDAISVRFCD